jgi:hypothetical protein
MEFVENDGVDAIEIRVALDHARQDAFSDEKDASVGTFCAFETGLKSDFVTNPAITLAGDTPSKHAGSQSARLENEDCASHVWVVDDVLGHLRRFAGASGGGEQHAVAFSQCLLDLAAEFANREFQANSTSSRLTCWASFQVK